MLLVAANNSSNNSITAFVFSSIDNFYKRKENRNLLSKRFVTCPSDCDLITSQFLEQKKKKKKELKNYFLPFPLSHPLNHPVFLSFILTDYLPSLMTKSKKENTHTHTHTQKET